VLDEMRVGCARHSKASDEGLGREAGGIAAEGVGMEALQIVSKGEHSAEADADFLNLRDPERMGRSLWLRL
jgi:hypothetical protein